MTTLKKIVFNALILASVSVGFTSCEGEDGLDGINGVDGQDGEDGVDGENGEDFTPSPEMFSNKSNIEPLVLISPEFNFVKPYSLISTTDVIGESNFQMAGSADGAGLLKDPESDGYIYVVNNEDHYAVSRIFLDKNLQPVKGDYLLNSGVSDWARQCSATMWEAAIHGGDKDIFLSASESYSNKVKAIDPYVKTPTPTANFGLAALGEFSWENAVPLPKDAYPGKTVIVGGDDDSNSSEGQVVVYYSENGDADLQNGKVYVLKLKEIADGKGGKIAATAGEIYNEGDLDFRGTYDVEFVEIPDAASKSVGEMDKACIAAGASGFMRVEDVDYQKGSASNNRNVYFNVTGKGPDENTYNDWGTVYKLVLDADSPLKGKLTQIVSGNTNTNKKDGNLASLQSPDNICVTENYVYFQEDPNSFTRNHNSYIYQSDLNGDNIKVVLRMKVDQNLAKDPGTVYDGEFGSLIDVSDKVGVEGTFLLALQPHYWVDDFFKGLDGDIISGRENAQGSQVIILQGLPR